MLCWISIPGGLLIMMGQHARSEGLFYYFRLEDQVPENLWFIRTRQLSAFAVRMSLHGQRRIAWA